MIWHKALFSFDGRLNRKGFWIGFGINFAFLFIFANFFLNPTAFNWISVMPLTVSFYSLAAVIVKRLHDRNRSGKALLMVLVPILCYVASLGSQGTMAFLLGTLMPVFISTVLLMEWGVFAGNPDANGYGEKGLSIKFK
ncbi:MULTISPECIES: DUF805 domain-containing protein [Glaesserella]|uniref:DUF805 domain-containing protein n=1 Tax=Glaesserella australis TaxID=2094024 RepID=A0A328C2K4_9PAST|nr:MULTISPECIES: DUF805 domain-containing protein [Glaesserella]AUI66258.1 hypothetical protein CJD39_06525 [Glaesserella sp. 15-184]RAL19280.1 DUF805 domain-containing protein [Glaesserella australis]